MIYANIEQITPNRRRRCSTTSRAARDSSRCTAPPTASSTRRSTSTLVGAQFRSHGTGIFRTTIAEPDHPVMKGFAASRAGTRPIVHTKHNEKDRTVLEYRVEGDVKEPWTWVRTQGKGRVFYTAWGHDERTWGQPRLPEPRRARHPLGRRRRSRPSSPPYADRAGDDRTRRRTSRRSVRRCQGAVLPAGRQGHQRQADHEDAVAASVRKSR